MFGGGNLNQVINQGTVFGGSAPSPKGSGASNASGKGAGAGVFVGSLNNQGNTKQGSQHSPPHHKYQQQQVPPPQPQYQHMQQVSTI